jgi:hypothetical protein
MQNFILLFVALYSIFWIWLYFDAKKAIIIDDDDSFHPKKSKL